MGRKKEGILVEFPWYDAFQSNKRAMSDSVAYEKASVLFNLAAVCSQQSLANDLATDGGLKAAARHFQVCHTQLMLNIAYGKSHHTDTRLFARQTEPCLLCLHAGSLSTLHEHSSSQAHHAETFMRCQLISLPTEIHSARLGTCCMP